MSPIPHGDLLIAAPRRWDEATFAVPAIRALAASGLAVGVLCEERQEGFWKTLTEVRVVTFPVGAKAKTIAAGLSGNWAAALAWEKGIGAEAFVGAKIGRRLGVEGKIPAKWLTHPLSITVSPLEHRVRFYLSAAEAMGVATDRAEFFSPADTGRKSSGGLLICPDSDFGAHYEWPLERWEEIARAFQERGISIEIGTFACGRGLGKLLAECLGGEIPLVELGELGKDLPLIAAYPSVLCADGSLAHLASHLGATCAVLFGPNDPAWKRPLGTRHRVIRQHVECAPCLLEKCVMDLRCQKELAVARVLKGLSL
ncbi:MAG: glycosyltransferase family 9 protein [Luteolibacter sp.]